MEPFLPFACPSCGMRSVAVGICPDCRLELVAEAVAPKAAPVAAPDLPGVHPIRRGPMAECRQAAEILRRAGVPSSIASAEALFQVLVAEGWEENAERILSEAWARDAQRLGHDPITDEEALALEGKGLCPACGDPLLPDGNACPSCGIALA